MRIEIEKAFKLIEANNEADFSGPTSPEMVIAAEKILGVSFPESYSLFLKKYGTVGVGSIEFFGIIKDPSTDGQAIPNGIWLTLDLRETEALPKEYVVVSETGFGPYYVIDTATKDINFESPVYTWFPHSQMEKVSNSFGEFVLTILGEAEMCD